MDRAIDPAAPDQRCVCGIDDRIDREPGDITEMRIQSSRRVGRFRHGNTRLS
jgi:hypothetical protein